MGGGPWLGSFVPIMSLLLLDVTIPVKRFSGCNSCFSGRFSGNEQAGASSALRRCGGSAGRVRCSFVLRVGSGCEARAEEIAACVTSVSPPALVRCLARALPSAGAVDGVGGGSVCSGPGALRCAWALCCCFQRCSVVCALSVGRVGLSPAGHPTGTTSEASTSFETRSVRSHDPSPLMQILLDLYKGRFFLFVHICAYSLHYANLCWRPGAVRGILGACSATDFRCSEVWAWASGGWGG